MPCQTCVRNLKTDNYVNGVLPFLLLLEGLQNDRVNTANEPTLPKAFELDTTKK